VKSARGLGSGIFLIGALVVGLLSPAGAEAAPGDLDPTFSGDGKQTTDFPFGNSSAAAIVRQPDGKLVAVGADRAHGNGDFALARYNPDGSLDPSFSGDGKQTTDFGLDDGATGVALQGDGKIVVVGGGFVGADGDVFALARYNPDGSLDPSFSGDGKQTTNFGNVDQANGVAVQGDGKIVAVGTAGLGGFALARYNADGSLDTSFSGDGKQTTAFGSQNSLDEGTAVALQPDGKIVMVGQADSVDFALARYNADGSLDTSLSGDGKQTTDFGRLDGATAVALQGDGKIVAVGGVHFDPNGTSSQDFALARYNPDGSLDPSFSGDGKQTTDFGGNGDQATAVALQGDGKIVAVGLARFTDFALARYNANGSLDASFSGDGKQTTNFGGPDRANGVALQGDGKIVAVGVGRGSNETTDFGIARYNSDGSLDTSFSGDGKQTTDFGGIDAANGVVLQGDGKVVAVGSAGGVDFALTRYNPDGSLDTSFSGDGKQTTNFGPSDQATAVALQGDGKIVVVGATSRPGISGDFALARYNTNGTLDTSFSGDGKETTNFGHTDVAQGVALQSDGKIVAVGQSDDQGFVLARYNADGALDTSFSGDGQQTTFFSGRDEATGVALQGDGKIVAVGRGGGAEFLGDFAIARYNTDGSPDTSFSFDGRQTTDFPGEFAEANGVALQANGKIVAVGHDGGGGVLGDFALARYNPNGSLDTSFSGDGMQTTDFGFGAGDGANGVALQADGKIVAVGLAGGGATGNDFALARYNANGSLDASFSGDGKRRTNFGGREDATGVALQPDGKIVAVGQGLGPNQTTDFALARYLGG
jgi:uncharacterized delta-60 repeat protein